MFLTHSWLLILTVSTTFSITFIEIDENNFFQLRFHGLHVHLWLCTFPHFAAASAFVLRCIRISDTLHFLTTLTWMRRARVHSCLHRFHRDESWGITLNCFRSCSTLNADASSTRRKGIIRSRVGFCPCFVFVFLGLLLVGFRSFRLLSFLSNFLCNIGRNRGRFILRSLSSRSCW